MNSEDPTIPTDSKSLVKDYHIKQEFCLNRPEYRRGKQLRAVKAYSISQESTYLLIQNVPALKLDKDLKNKLMKFGTIEKFEMLEKYPCEKFMEAYLVKFSEIFHSRLAKRKLDNFSFFGGILHICYAPEYESVDDANKKIMKRILDVEKRYEALKNNKKQLKRKHSVVSKQDDEIDDNELRKKAIILKDIQGPSLIPK